jgi:ribosome-associated protein
LRKENAADDSAQLSKSQRKREAQELKFLAAELIGLNEPQFRAIPLEEGLRSAIEDARHIRSNIARKRQLQFVAKLLRRADATPILEAVEGLQNDARQFTARHHRAEAWRTFLISSGDEALETFLRSRKDADAQEIRQLIRNAQREVRAGKPPSAARSLFRRLREMDQDQTLPPCV